MIFHIPSLFKNIPKECLALLRAHADIRLKPPSFVTDNQWMVEHLSSRKRYRISPLGVYILIFCVESQNMEQLAEEIPQKLQVSEKDVRRTVESLCQANLLTFDEGFTWSDELKNNWSYYQWEAAADYYLSTFDYEFLGADRQGVEGTRQKMFRYSQEEPDTNRTKVYESAFARFSVPLPGRELVAVPISRVIEEKDEMERDPLHCNQLFEMLTMSFGIVGTMKPYWGGEPLIRRTSPSGGARHPSEAYVAILDVEGLNQGWYHFSTGSSELALIREDGADLISMQALFPNTFSRAPFPVKAVVLITSVFERNMYRYREPRTFRTVHMDAGHLQSTLEWIADAFERPTFVQYGAVESKVEEALGINGLDEGFMLSMALG